ncbi:MAG: hypothetical protein J6B43_00135, partial [Lachnospiraceae bacterium]|nr:hypothetical protein [Lachnospiraceae bacterium]
MAGMMSGCGPENESAGGNVEQPGELVSENTSGSEEQANHTGAEDSSERGKVSGEENAEAREYLVKELHYQEEQLAYTSEREYDAHDNLLRAVWYDAEGNISEAAEYVYDTNDNMVKMTWYDAEGNLSFQAEREYDANGNEVMVTHHDAEGITFTRKEYEYDTDGRLVKRIDYWEEQVIGDYAYDTNGNLVKEIWYGAGGDVFRWSEGEYDAKGNMVKMTWYEPDNRVYGWSEYEYDLNGN